MASRFTDIGDTPDESQARSTFPHVFVLSRIFSCVLSKTSILHRQYEQYTARRIPGKQAVVVMACDNTHISDDMILEPGIVMIFAHGIE